MYREQYYLKKLQQVDIGLLFKNIFKEILWEDLFTMNSVSYVEFEVLINNIISLANNDTYLYYFDNNPIGYLRITYESTIASVSYSLNKELRGQGYGRKLLDLFRKELTNNKSQHDEINISVKSNNVALQIKLEESKFDKFVENNYIRYVKEVSFNHDNERSGDKLCIHNQGGILLLTNNSNSLVLYNWLKEHEKRVLLYSLPINYEQIINMKVDYIISYNYVHIIKEDIIKIMKNRIINLHTSLLPWNKGLRPNFWSFIEDTPKGITIHYIDEGIDTGAILLQKEIKFDESKETFLSTYNYLNCEIVNLFITNWDLIKQKKILVHRTEENGTYHSMKNFIEFTKNNPIDWDVNISSYKNKIK